MLGRAMQHDPHGRPPDHARAHGLRRRTSPEYVLPNGRRIPVDWSARALPPVTLAAAVGDTGQTRLLVDSAADFEFVMLQNPPAAPVLVTMTLVGGPFSGVELTTKPIDSRHLFGTGPKPGFIPAGTWIPKNSTLRIQFTNLTATAQTIRPVLGGRDVYTPDGESIHEHVPPRLPYFVGYEFLPLAASASDATDDAATHTQMTSGDFELISHNVISEAAVGAGALAGALQLNFRDRGQLKRTLFPDPVPAEAIAGDGTEPHYVPTRRLILAGDTFEPRATDSQAVPAAQFVRGVLAGVLHVDGFQEPAE